MSPLAVILLTYAAGLVAWSLATIIINVADALGLCYSEAREWKRARREAVAPATFAEPVDLSPGYPSEAALAVDTPFFVQIGIRRRKRASQCLRSALRGRQTTAAAMQRWTVRP